MISDSDIIRRVKSGRSDDFRELVSRYQRRSLSLAYRMLGRWDDAEDAAQDAFICAFRSLHTFSGEASFWPWLRKIVINCCYKRSSREVPMDNIDTILDSASEPFIDSIEEQVFRKCEMETVRSAILGLPQNHRMVIVLRYQEDLSTPEIADVLNLPAGTVRVRLHRALKMLSERLAVILNDV